MDEILLTENETWLAILQGKRDWSAASFPLGRMRDYESAALCRAQLRKFVEWLYGDCDKHEPSPFAFVLPVTRIECEECQHALRAAAEEVRG
jgi:hypothetical protein